MAFHAIRYMLGKSIYGFIIRNFKNIRRFLFMFNLERIINNRLILITFTTSENNIDTIIHFDYFRICE